MINKQLIGLCLASFLLTGYTVGSSEKHYEEFRPHMRAIYSSLMTVFPLALSRAQFVSQDKQKLIQENLDQIAEHAKLIQKLSGQDEKGHSFLSQQLERNARQAAHKFREGYLDQSQFFVEELYDTCVGCHTSRTSTADSKFTIDFAESVKTEGLGTFGKAKFLALSRQFEQATAEYERIFLSESLSLEEMLHFDPLVDYLVLALRVKGEPQRVEKTLQALVKKNLPAMIKHDLEAWQKSLKSVAKASKKESDLSYAKRLLQKARLETEYPRDRSGLVYYLIASKALRESLNDTGLKAGEKAESYFQLGIAELGIGEPFLATESGLYFEEAIRLAPKAQFAKKAFALYEESIMFGYSGSSGTSLPASEKSKLEELRKMVF